MSQKQTVGQATASMVLGILSFVALGLLSAIPAVICGHIAKKKIKADPENLQGDGMALAGLIMGYITIGFSMLIIPLLLAIAIPSFNVAREAAMENVCNVNLMQIEYAKEQYGVEQNLPDGSPITDQQVGIYIAGGMDALICPNAGEYSINNLGETPECSIHGTVED